MMMLWVILIGLSGPALIAYWVWNGDADYMVRRNKLIQAYLTGKLPNGPDPNPVMGPPAPRKPMPIFWKIALFGFIGLMLFGFIRDVLG